jgi:hypothetical protein
MVVKRLSLEVPCGVAVAPIVRIAREAKVRRVKCIFLELNERCV